MPGFPPSLPVFLLLAESLALTKHANSSRLSFPISIRLT